MPGAIIFLLVIAAAFGQDQQYVISTFAGGGPVPARVPAKDLAIDWFSKGLMSDAAGNAYFTSLNCVFRLDRDGIVTRIAGNSRRGYSGDGGPALTAQFSTGQIVESPPYLGSLPPGLAVDNAGNVYIADNGNSRIRKISADGIVTTVAGNGTFGFSGDGGSAVNAQLSSVLGLAVDPAGNLLLADSDNHRIRRVASDGTITTVAGNGICGSSGDGSPAAGAQLCNPSGIAMDRGGNLFIAETGNNRIRRIYPDGTITTAASGLIAPTNISTDGEGNLIVVSQSGNFYDEWQAIRTISADGKVTVVAGDACRPGTAYCPPSPSDGSTAIKTYLGDRLSTAVDSDGNLLVAAPYNRHIYRVFRDGSIAIAAGSGDYDFSGDGGPATSARLTPGSLAVDSAGTVFFVDPGNARIRKVTPDGIISTVAGNGIWGTGGDGGPAAEASLSPTGVAVDAAGNLFISENLSGVRKVTPDGVITPVAAGRGYEAIAVDLADNLFVATYSSIHKISADGGNSEVVSPAVSLALDRAGNLFLAEAFRVHRLAPDGSIVTVAGNGTQGFSGDGGPATDAQFDHAAGVAVDSAGNLFIADRGNNRIRKVSTNGIITTIAGTGARDYAGDGGPAREAILSAPGSVAVDGAGSVYFTDSYNGVIRVLRPEQLSADR